MSFQIDVHDMNAEAYYRFATSKLRGNSSTTDTMAATVSI